MAPQRPNLVGLVCWVLIIGGFGGLVLGLKSSGGADFHKTLNFFPYPPPVAMGLMFGSRAVLVIIGILLYERHGWARYLFIAFVPVFLLHQFFALALDEEGSLKQLAHQAALAAGGLGYLLGILILFLRPARRYYRPPRYIDE